VRRGMAGDDGNVDANKSAATAGAAQNAPFDTGRRRTNRRTRRSFEVCVPQTSLGQRTRRVGVAPIPPMREGVLYVRRFATVICSIAPIKMLAERIFAVVFGLAVSTTSAPACKPNRRGPSSIHRLALVRARFRRRCGEIPGTNGPSLTNAPGR